MKKLVLLFAFQTCVIAQSSNQLLTFLYCPPGGACIQIPYTAVPTGLTGGGSTTTDASQLITGTLPFARLPIGTTAGTVAAGNDSRIVGAVPTTSIGAINGVAGLDGTGKVPTAQLPSPTVSQISFGPFASAPAPSAAFFFKPLDSFFDSIVSSGNGVSHYLIGGHEYTPPFSFPTWYNQNGAIETTTGGTDNLRIFTSNPCCSWTGKTATLPAHTLGYTFTAFIRSNQSLMAAGATTASMWIGDGTNRIGIDLLGNPTSPTQQACSVRVDHYSGATSGGTDFYTEPTPLTACFGGITGLRIVDNSSALTYFISLDGGSTWRQLGSTDPSTGGSAFIPSPTLVAFGGLSLTTGTILYVDVSLIGATLVIN